MRTRSIFFAAPIARIRAERRRRVVALWLNLAVFVALVALVVWLCAVVKRAGVPALPSIPGLAMWPMTEGELVFGLLFALFALVYLAVRKTAAASGGMTNEEGRMRKDADVFEPLRSPGEAIPAEDVERILVACAAEGRCIMKHVRRAQTTLSVEDYGDELRLAERKLDAVVRCVEALAARCAGMTKPETRNQKDAEVLGDIECCEIEGRDAV